MGYTCFAQGSHMVCTWFAHGLHLVCTWFASCLHMAELVQHNMHFLVGKGVFIQLAYSVSGEGGQNQGI